MRFQKTHASVVLQRKGVLVGTLDANIVICNLIHESVDARSSWLLIWVGRFQLDVREPVVCKFYIIPHFADVVFCVETGKHAVLRLVKVVKVGF